MKILNKKNVIKVLLGALLAFALFFNANLSVTNVTNGTSSLENLEAAQAYGWNDYENGDGTCTYEYCYDEYDEDDEPYEVCEYYEYFC